MVRVHLLKKQGWRQREKGERRDRGELLESISRLAFVFFDWLFIISYFYGAIATPIWPFYS